MGKVIFWFVVVFAVLFALRLWNAAKAKRRAESQRQSAATGTEAMVRCQSCGVFLPRTEAIAAGEGYVCGDSRCRQHR